MIVDFKPSTTLPPNGSSQCYTQMLLPINFKDTNTRLPSISLTHFTKFRSMMSISLNWSSWYFKFTVMPFSIKKALTTFQYLMYCILDEFYKKFVYVYLNNIIIFFRMLKEHIDHLWQVLTKIRKANLKIKPSKCQ